MQIVHSAEKPMVERKDTQREGRFIEKTFLKGERGTKDNFKFYMVEQFGDFYSPRHKHNFDQIRVQLEGTTSYHKDGTMTPGVVGYFPEGTPYGPTTITTDRSLIIILQVGGPSGSGYPSAEERDAAVVALKKTGEFHKGVYTSHTGEGRKNQDAFEACWEYINKTSLVYPKERFQGAVFTDPAAFTWRPIASSEGVFEKPLGSYDLGLAMRCIRVDRASTFTATGRQILYVLSGSGRSVDESWTAGDVIYLDHGETGSLEASDDAELFAISMPLITA
ncbi:MAG: hypothetical protein JWQ23_3628 [Herminiimonas sp.]|nr:hypothetical protein [Herminiimonas sp.]